MALTSLTSQSLILIKIFFNSCKMNLLDIGECEISEKADVSLVICNVAVFFIGGLLVSTFGWTGASLKSWARYFKR